MAMRRLRAERQRRRLLQQVFTHFADFALDALADLRSLSACSYLQCQSELRPLLFVDWDQQIARIEAAHMTPISIFSSFSLNMLLMACFACVDWSRADAQRYSSIDSNQICESNSGDAFRRSHHGFARLLVYMSS